MGDRPRGRGFGRGRGRDADRPPTTPFTSTSTASAWGRKPGPPSQSEARPSQAIPRAVQPGPHGVGGSSGHSGDTQSQRSETKSSSVAGSASSAIGGSGDTGRGSMRGRRALPLEILNTKPQHVQSKSGVKGRRVMLQTNYFKLVTTTDWAIYQYRVDFLPEEDRTVVRKGLLKLHKETLGAYIFDGTVLYTSNRHPDKFELCSTRQSDNAQIQISIKLVGDMMKGDHHYLQFFNIIMKKCLGCLDMQLVGRNYFEPRSKVEVAQYRLELWPGYIASIRQHERDILMCSEVIHKVMRQDTLFDILNQCYQDNKHNFKDAFQKAVAGTVVLTSYNNNTYRVDGIDFNATPESTFKLRNGESVSYIDYYFNKYQIRIRSRTQPMLVCRTKAKDRRAGQPEEVYLVPELCQATGLTDNMRANFSLMKAVADHTRVRPGTRINTLMSFNHRLRTDPRIVNELREWNLTLDEKLTEVPGRLLDSENLITSRGQLINAGPQADWTMQLRRLHMFRCAELKNWVIVYTERQERNVTSFLSILKKAASGLQFQIREPQYCPIRDDRSTTYASCLENIMSKTNPELIFCVLPNIRADRYIAIKKKCCIDRPVPTQVYLEKNLANQSKTMSIATKVAIQINCKLGGAPWICDIPSTDTMVVGFDVSHSKTGTSFGALIASLDKNLTRYYSAVTVHSSDEELSNEMSVQMCKAVHKYREFNNTFPTRIIMYRDGVGEGQIPYVFKHEVENMNRQLGALYGNPAAVKMAYIIVTKRLNTRLFYNRDNPAPGTVVDDVITNAMKYDFFIISQSVKQGTVSPTGYNVIFDSTGWSPDIIQRLSYKLTHLYFNCAATVRVPAPCQYAHKLAFLVTECLRQPPSALMDTLLYFL